MECEMLELCAVEGVENSRRGCDCAIVEIVIDYDDRRLCINCDMYVLRYSEVNGTTMIDFKRYQKDEKCREIRV